MSEEHTPIRLAAGPRAAEAEVVRWVRERLAGEASELWPPLRIVVPSWSLKRHLLAVLARELGALAGVVVQTHRALAREILENAGAPALPGGSPVQELLVRGLAAAEPALSDALGDLEDGFAPVVATVRDLIDAGLDETSLEAAAEAVAAATDGALRTRSVAVLQVAARWLMTREERSLPGRSRLLERAARTLEDSPDSSFPARGVLIHGFAEATGLVSDLLEALIRRLDAEIVLDHPPDPARPAEREAGWTFTSRLADRLAGPGSVDRIEWAGAPEPPTLEAFTAPGPEAEVREAARRIRLLLDSGATPESIGVIARIVDSAAAASIRRHFGRLGIPFSGEGVTVPGGDSLRRAEALLEVLDRGERAGTSSWLTAAASLPGVDDTRLLELALRSTGANTIAQAAALEPGAASLHRELRLPVVERVEESDGLERRIFKTCPRESLETAVGAARRLMQELQSRPAEGEIRELLTWVRRVLDRLGHRPAAGPEAPALRAIAALEAELPGDLVVSWKDLAPVLAGALQGAGAVGLGGEGGGAQVLTVMEARGRTFDHLFLLGLNRGVFPRRPREDAVLPEGVRRALTAVLPEIPLAERSRIEERYLFAQVVASSPRVTLSWRSVDADGKHCNPSAFLERLRLEERLPETVEATGDIFGERADDGPRPALEHATVAGLARNRPGLVQAAETLGDERAAHLAAVLDEMDPPHPRDELGPFLGLTGVEPPAELWVTRLEAYAVCPWKQFLERDLGLAPPPDSVFAGTRLAGRLTGAVVHHVLEHIARNAGVPSSGGVLLDDLADLEAVPVPWPDRDRLAELAAEEAARTADEEGVPALASALARAALPFLRRAEELDWSSGVREILGTEVTGACELAPRGAYKVTVRFRADRVDRRDGTLVLTDYKTGRAHRTKAATSIPRGELLQGAAYAWVAGDGGSGRYLYLKDGAAKDAIEVSTEDATALVEVVDILLGAWREGVLLPRWSKPAGEESTACRYCEVKEACFKGDSTFRARLDRAVAARALQDPEDSAVRLWKLPARGADS
ncbi:MAG: PD-(D/E)XK nuclease family protein [Thermoanaerobaculales bacterium]